MALSLRLAAAIAVGAITLVAGVAVWASVARPSGASSGGGPPIGGLPPFELGEATEASVGDSDWYNWTVLDANGSVPWTDFSAAVLDGQGNTAPPTTGWTVSILAPGEGVVGVYAMATGHWSAGTLATAEGGQGLSFETRGSPSLAGTGATFVLTITGGPYSGSGEFAIP